MGTRAIPPYKAAAGHSITEYTSAWPWRVRGCNPGRCPGRHSAWRGPSSPRRFSSAAPRPASRKPASAGAQAARRPIAARSIPPTDCLARREWPPRIARYRRCRVRPRRLRRRERAPRRQEPLLFGKQTYEDWTCEAPPLMAADHSCKSASRAVVFWGEGGLSASRVCGESPSPQPSPREGRGEGAHRRCGDGPPYRLAPALAC